MENSIAKKNTPQAGQMMEMTQMMHRKIEIKTRLCITVLRLLLALMNDRCKGVGDGSAPSAARESHA